MTPLGVDRQEPQLELDLGYKVKGGCSGGGGGVGGIRG